MDSDRPLIMLPKAIKRMLPEERTLIDRERVTLLLVCYLPISSLDVLANILGFSIKQPLLFTYTHGAFFIIILSLLALYLTKKIRISTCLIGFTLSGQIKVSIEMIHVAFTPTMDEQMLILANMVLLLFNAMVSMAAALRWNTLTMSAITIVTYIVCVVVSGSESLACFMAVFCISFFFVGVAGWISADNVRILKRENVELKKGEAELLSLLKLKKNDLQTFISLASKKYPTDGLSLLIENLDNHSRHNLLTNIDFYLKDRKADLGRLETTFPEFTPSELRICRLILQGKKLSDICIMLDKSESNVNSQRANMRKKLGLTSSDNLAQALQQRVDNN